MREANSFDLSLLILLAVIWGSAFFNIKIATYSYEPFTLALVRVIFASIPLLLLCKLKKIKIEAFSYNWQLNKDKIPFFIKYGYIWFLMVHLRIKDHS